MIVEQNDKYTLIVKFQEQEVILALWTFDLLQNTMKIYSQSFSNQNANQLFLLMFDDVPSLFRNIFESKANYQITKFDEIMLNFTIKVGPVSYPKKYPLKLSQQNFTKEQQLRQIISKKDLIHSIERQSLIQRNQWLAFNNRHQLIPIFNRNISKFQANNTIISLKKGQNPTTLFFNVPNQFNWEINVIPIKTKQYLSVGLCGQSLKDKKFLDRDYANKIQICESGQVEYHQNRWIKFTDIKHGAKEIKINKVIDQSGKDRVEFFIDGKKVFFCNIFENIRQPVFLFHLNLFVGGDSALINFKKSLNQRDDLQVL